jgi:hypothetical protein
MLFQIFIPELYQFGMTVMREKHSFKIGLYNLLHAPLLIATYLKRIA